MRYLIAFLVIELAVFGCTNTVDAPASMDNNIVDSPDDSTMANSEDNHPTDIGDTMESDADTGQEIDEMSYDTPDTYVDLSPDEAKMFIEEFPDVIIIDVSPDYAEGHLPGAITIILPSEKPVRRGPPTSPSLLLTEATEPTYCSMVEMGRWATRTS